MSLSEPGDLLLFTAKLSESAIADIIFLSSYLLLFSGQMITTRFVQYTCYKLR